MFTFGIFTTHFPYIAFVLFYAYFLIFGIGQASSGEIRTGEKYYQTEWVSEYHYNPATTDLHFFGDANTDEFYGAGPGDFLFRQKIKYPQYICETYRPDGYCTLLFCRPPPAV